MGNFGGEVEGRRPGGREGLGGRRSGRLMGPSRPEEGRFDHTAQPFIKR